MRKQDKRNIDTKLMIADAFKELARAKQINKITINDIVSYCKINRNTFYYHFEDIYDLANWIAEVESKQLLENAMSLGYEDFFNIVFDYIESNKHLLSSAYNSLGREQLRKIFYPHFYKLLDTVIVERISSEGVDIDNDFKNFLIDFYTGGLSELIIGYCNDERVIEREKLINYLFSLLNSIPVKQNYSN